MYKKLLLLAMLCVALVIAAACGNGGNDTPAPTDPPAATEAPAATQPPAPGEDLDERAEVEIDGDREFVEFRWHANYTWATNWEWGADAVSRHWGNMFNIHANLTSPDELADETLNLMIIAGDMPDAIWMDRGNMLAEIARMGLLYSIDELRAMVDNNWYNENVPASTQRHYEIDGVNYVIPNWVRMGEIGVPGGAAGGNMAWMKNTNVHDAVGAPELVTFEDLFDYAVAIRDAGLTNHTGAPMIPVLFNGGPNFGQEFVNAIFLSFGGMSEGWGGWYGIHPETNTFGSFWDNPVWRDAVMEANRWFREGLFPATHLTNSQDQFEELMVGGRGGLIQHDHSTDDAFGFRRIVRENDPGNSIEVIRHEVNGHPFLYLPSSERGLTHSDITHQIYGTLGWNTSVIVRGTAHPGRLFELFTWQLTPLGAIEWTLGPQGYLWDELDANGFPILHTPPASLSSEEFSDLGLWRWDRHGHANHVDDAKFAANARLPIEDQNWVETMQMTLFTPNLILSDEFQNMFIQIDSLSDLGIRRAMIEDHFEEWLPQIIIAPTAEDAERMFDSVRDFAFANGMYEIQEIYNANWEFNNSMQGGSIFQNRW